MQARLRVDSAGRQPDESPAPASAQSNYPSRPITMIVPFAPGGATDAIARILNESLSQTLGQRKVVVIETVGGAGGMIGSARVARAAPDGYTVLLHQVGLAAGMTLYPNPTFDAEKDLTGIGLVNNSASVIAGRPDLPPNTMKELVAWMKEPGRITKVAHAGVGAFGHLCGVLFVQEIGAWRRSRCPYRGGGPGAQRPGGRPCRRELPVGRDRRGALQSRQAQGLWHRRQESLRWPS